MSGMQWHRLSNGNAACGPSRKKFGATSKTPIPFLSGIAAEKMIETAGQKAIPVKGLVTL
jgi:hypothetical protein